MPAAPLKLFGFSLYTEWPPSGNYRRRKLFARASPEASARKGARRAKGNS